MAGEHIIYLSSSDSCNLFTENNPGRFINRLATPIVLDSNIDYEIGLVSILYPDQYYAIQANQDDYNILIHTTQEGHEKRNSFTVKINKNILAGEMRKIIKVINRNLIDYLKVHYYDFFPLIIGDRSVIKWNEMEDRAEILFNQGSNDSTTDIKEINLQMGNGLAEILGFRGDTEYTIFSVNEGFKNMLSNIPPSPRCGVDYIYLYTDIIQPTRFGGQLLNILDCFTLQNVGNKGVHNCIYKPINTNFIDQISIIITDQRGRFIYFRDDATITLALHLRPK